MYIHTMSYLQAVENKLMTVRVLKCTNALRHFLSAVGIVGTASTL